MCYALYDITKYSGMRSAFGLDWAYMHFLFFSFLFFWLLCNRLSRLVARNICRDLGWGFSFSGQQLESGPAYTYTCCIGLYTTLIQHGAFGITEVRLGSGQGCIGRSFGHRHQLLNAV